MSYSDIKDILQQVQTELQDVGSSYSYLDAVDDYNIMLGYKTDENAFKHPGVFVYAENDKLMVVDTSRYMSELTVKLLVVVKGYNTSELLTDTIHLVGDIHDLLRSNKNRQLSNTADLVGDMTKKYGRFPYNTNVLRWCEITFQVRRDHEVS